MKIHTIATTLALFALTACSFSPFTDDYSRPRMPVAPTPIRGPITEPVVIPQPVTPTVKVSTVTPKTTLIKTKDDPRYSYYDGTVTLSGKYREYSPENMGGELLCFFPNQDMAYLIPREGEDARLPWFCFDDQTKAKDLFKVDDKKIFSDKKIDCIEGDAKIKISHYVVDHMEAEVSDLATLEQLISFEPYSLTCQI